MRIIKYSIFLLSLVSFTSCLKSKNDFGGLREDKGNIVTSITEKQYINTDAQNIGFGYTNSFANFSFTTPATEDVKFFTVHISQPRETKLSGPLALTVRMTPLTGYTAIPAGAITIPSQVSVPQSSASAFDYAVKFTVNKALLNANTQYGATFSISSPNQGVVSALDSSIDVVVNFASTYNNSRYTGRYIWSSTVVDPARQYGITNNTKPVVLEENAAGRLDIYDWYITALGGGSTASYLFANNLSTGANYAIFAPRYVLDATGKVTSILNQGNPAAGPVTNLALDASGTNQFTYTANDNRSFSIKYSFTLTTAVNGVSTPRTVTVTETFTYDGTQVFY